MHATALLQAVVETESKATTHAMAVVVCPTAQP
jgi:hypothetical protein